MTLADRLRRLSSDLVALAKDGVEVGAFLTLRDGRYGVAFLREREGEPETLLELDLARLAEKLEGEG